MMSKQKVVLAYSGGLDTSVILKWLQEHYDYEVIAMVADVGQDDQDMEVIRERALAAGARQVFIEDVKLELVTGYIFPMLQSGAVYEGKYLLGTAIARPLIAKKLVEIAEKTGAAAIAHGATGKGNDQVRFELTIQALCPGMKIIAPWREWEIGSRAEAIAYAEAHCIPVSVTAEKPYSIDHNLWHASYEGGILEDPDREPDPAMFRLTRSPEEAPEQPALVEIAWERGNPVAVNGTNLDPVSLVVELNRLAGEHAVGRVDLVENRLVGMKSRGIYETPAGTVLAYAHRELEHLTLDRETLHFKETVALKYAELIYYGLWHSALRTALDGFIASTQERVSGTIALKLYKGNLIVAGRRSPYSLYNTDLATFEAGLLYDQRDAHGFINIFGLPLKVQGMLSSRFRSNGKKEAI